MTLVDTCGWIEWLTEGALAARFAPYMKDPADLLVPTTAQYESYKWVKRESDETTAHDTIALADAVIYASAKKHCAELVTSDDHFEGLPDVTYFPK